MPLFISNTISRNNFFSLILGLFLSSFLWGEVSASENPRATDLCENALLSRGWSAFSVDDEFPNHFLSDRFQGRGRELLRLEGSEKESLERELHETRLLLEEAISVVMESLVFPVVAEGGGLRFAYFIREAIEILNLVDPDARLKLSGGVVRSTLGLFYKLAHDRYLEKGRVDIRALLGKITKKEHSIFSADGTISIYAIRGIGSDFDLLIDTPNPNRFARAREALNQFIDQVREAFMLAGADAKLEKAVFTVADIRPDFNFYDSGEIRSFERGQTERSVEQGGATIDFLLFDLSTRKFASPSEYPRVAEDYLMGFYEYVAAKEGEVREDFGATVFRGPRALVESPQLRLKDSRVFIKEVLELIGRIKSGRKLTESALTQVGKMLRNARFYGANNRVVRSPEGSALGYYRMLLKEASDHQDLPDGRPIQVPNYARGYPIGRASLELPEYVQEALLSREDFVSDYLEDGVVYHGTPSIEWAMAIMRGGFRETLYESGFRRGTYFSPMKSVSGSYRRGSTGRVVGHGGALFSLELKPDIPIRIFDVRKLPEREVGRFYRILEEYKRGQSDLEFSDILASIYGVDIIILNDVELLIKNPAILKEVTIESFIRGIPPLFMGSNLPIDWVGAYLSYRGLYPLGVTMGLDGLPEVPLARDMVEKLIRSDWEVDYGNLSAVCELFNYASRLKEGGMTEEQRERLYYSTLQRMTFDTLTKLSPTNLRMSTDLGDEEKLKDRVRALVEERVRGQASLTLDELLAVLRAVEFDLPEALVQVISEKIPFDEVLQIYETLDWDKLDRVSQEIRYRWKGLVKLVGKELVLKLILGAKEKIQEMPEKGREQIGRKLVALNSFSEFSYIYEPEEPEHEWVHEEALRLIKALGPRESWDEHFRFMEGGVFFFILHVIIKYHYYD